MIELGLLIRGKNESDAAFATLQNGMDGVANRLKQLPPATEEWSKAQQRAAQRMEALHEEALKMNLGFKSADDGAQLFSQTLGQATGIVTVHEKAINQLAGAYGLPAVPLKELASTVDVTGLGFNQLTKSAVGFNAASLTTAGAGLTLGIALGTLARDVFPAMTKAVDGAAESLLRLVTGIETADATAGLAELAKSQEANAARAAKVTVDAYRAQGKSLEEIKKIYKEMPPAIDKYISSLEKQTKAQKEPTKAADENAKMIAEANARLAEQQQDALIKGLNEYIRQYGELKKREEEIDNRLFDEKGKLWKSQSALQKKAYDEMVQAVQDYAEFVEKQAEREKELHQEHIESLARHFSGLSELLSNTGDLFVALGEDANSSLVRITDGLAHLAGVASDVFSKLASGNVLGAIGSGIGGVASIVGGLFGDKEHMRVNDMRDEFVAAAGGLAALGQKAAGVGLTLNRLLNAKTVKDYEAAVREIEDAWDAADKAAQRALDLQLEGQQKLQEAMERYGLTIEEMGPKFAQQELDKQAMQLFEDYELLSAAGADHNAVLSKMAPEMQEYVNTALSAGSTIPESLRPMIEQMIEMGLLTDENGVAFESLEESGIKFAESLEEGLGRTIDAIKELVDVLKRLYGMGPPDLPAPPGPGDDGGNGNGHAMGGWFPYKPGGYPITVAEAGDEAVMNTAQIKQLVAMAGGSQPGGRYVIENHVHIGSQELIVWLNRQKAAGFIH